MLVILTNCNCKFLGIPRTRNKGECMGYSIEETIFREKLLAFGIKDPKVIERPSGMLIAYPQPGSDETWKASYFHEEDQRFEYVDNIKPKG